MKRGGELHLIIVEIRYDDQCNNGHNTFSITGEIWKSNNKGQKVGRDCIACGCIHDEIIKHFPHLKRAIDFHLCSSDGPMYYIESTMYHIEQHKAQSGWLYGFHPISDETLIIKYGKINKLEKIINDYKGGGGKEFKFKIKLDPKTEKKADLEAARNSAIWSDAKTEDFTVENLKARLPELMKEFKSIVESFGFTY